jgi:hypothetical protein
MMSNAMNMLDKAFIASPWGGAALIKSDTLQCPAMFNNTSRPMSARGAHSSRSVAMFETRVELLVWC